MERSERGERREESGKGGTTSVIFEKNRENLLFFQSSAKTVGKEFSRVFPRKDVAYHT